MAEKLLASGVTAAVLGHHETAKGALLHFQDQGVRWPEDISLVMIGTPEWAGVLLPRITCVQRPEHQMGAAAAQLLLSAIKDPDAPPVQQVFPCFVSSGESVLRK